MRRLPTARGSGWFIVSVLYDMESADGTTGGGDRRRRDTRSERRVVGGVAVPDAELAVGPDDRGLRQLPGGVVGEAIPVTVVRAQQILVALAIEDRPLVEGDLADVGHDHELRLGAARD